MQPTLLVKSKKPAQAIDSSSPRMATSSKRRACYQSLKSASWAAAFGSLFIFAQTYALSLQNMQINSALGEPLDAIVMVNAAPGEVLQASCMRTGSNVDSGMPGIRGVRLSLSRNLSPGTLRLTTSRPITEPMSEILVHIECPGAPSVKRSFLIMLDPRGETIAATPVPSTSGFANNQDITGQYIEESPEALNPSASKVRPLSAPVVTSTDNRVSVRSRQVIVSRGTPVDPGSDYVVATGDALSTIAARITGRDYGTVWSWAATIQAANPHAFINGNPNELIAGSKLYVPNTLAAGTAGLTVARSTQTPVSRYADSFSTRTNEQSAPTLSDSQTPTATLESAQTLTPAEPVAVITGQPVAAGSIRAIQPVMVMATSFSSVSRDRLRQRSRGLIQAAPNNLPDFMGEAANQNQTSSSGQDAQNNQGQPKPEGTQQPEAAVAAKPEAATTPSSGRRISFLGILGGLGLLAGAFFTGWWLSRRRADAEMQEQLEARLNEERYRERVRSGRQDAIRGRLSSGAATAAGFEVTETAPEPTLKPSAFTEEDIDEVIEAAVEEEAQAQTVLPDLDINIAEPIVDNDVPMIDPIELEFDTNENHELADIDLELLERDYAAQTETNTGLEEIAAAGRGAQVPDDSELDQEFPEAVKMREESAPSFDTLEFDPRAEPLDFDIGSGLQDEDIDKTEALGLELEEAGASIDAHLEQLRKQDSEVSVDSSDATAEIDMNPTERFEIDPTAEHEITDLVIENLLEDDEMTGTSTQDAEEFYHLEASSIMNVGELDFEKGPDDETNILRFRQRSIRTGTDDTSGDEE